MKRRYLALFLACCSAAVAADRQITVAPDGSGDCKTLQEAIQKAPDQTDDRTTILIQPGTYKGPFVVGKQKGPITFKGSGAEKTVLTWDRNVYEPIPEGSDKFNPTLQVKANGFTAEDLTVENTSGDHGQALAVRVDSDRAVFRNVRLLGWQDTLMVNNGRQFFKDCYIEGRVDFIYGSGTAVFKDCHIHSKNGGYVTAASTPQEKPYGFVFIDCKLTGSETPWNPATTNPSTTQPARKPDKRTFLGRPWRPYGSVAFINCDMGDHIRPEGWNNWRKASNEKTARYAEYGSTGPGGDMSQRVPWANKLTEAEAKEYTIPHVLAGDDHWDPTQQK